MRRRNLRVAAVSALAAGALLTVPASGNAATITPNIGTDEFTIGDDPNCSLREAVVSASDNGPVGGCDAFDGNLAYGNDTIVLNLPVVNYGLTLSGAGEDDGLTGDLDVTGPVTVMAPPDFIENHVISQTISDRIFDLQTAGSHLTLRRITLTGGSSGGAGGAINATVPGNDITLDLTTVANSSGQSGGGVRIDGNGSSLLATDSAFTHNSVSTGGAGLSAGPGSTVSLTRPFFFGNKATSPFPNGQPGGGAIDANAANVTVVDGLFTENEASSTDPTGDWGRGGAIRSNATLSIEGSLFEENLAFSNGPAAAFEYGGALHVSNPGDTEVVNSTFYANAAGNGNVPGEDARGGAIYRNGGALDVRFSTFLDNDSTGAGADSIDNGNSGGQMTFSASLFAASENVCEGNDDTLISEGYNVAPPDAHCEYDVTDDIGIGDTAIIDADPAVNGGPTRTIGLNATGRGLDQVPFAECAASAGGFDARNYPRSGPDVGAACDAGAYERTVCNGVLQNVDFTPCPVIPPATGGSAGQSTPQQPAPATKKCKKAKKKKKGKSAAKKKRCGKKKGKRKRRN